MMRSMNAVKIAVLIAVFGFYTPAKADDVYNFTLNSTSGSSLAASGVFTLSGAGLISSVSGVLDLPSYSINLTYSHPVSYINNSNMYAFFMSVPGQYTNSLTITGNITSNNGNYSGLVMTGGSNIGGTGFFEAMLSSGSGTGGGSSGGAPSPEVNTFLGLALAASTMAFLRRRRGKQNKRVVA